MYIKTDGIVLREVAYQDSDKLLTVLTREYGKLTVRARGVRSSRSRSKAACQLLAYSEFTLLERGGRYVVTEATAKEMFPELRNDLELLSLASYFAEAAEAVCAEETTSPEILSLLLNALYALCYLHKEPRLVKAAFQFRLMALAGFEPLASGCAVCGSEEPEAPMLDVVHGVVHCGGCKRLGGLSMPLTAAGLAALRHVLYCDSRRLYGFTLEPEALRELDHAGEAFIAGQLERSFRTLDYYKSLLI